MMFAKKCPKCGGNVQTKSIKKSIGLGFVNIPVAQFCLNPVCDWYQDFAEAREPEEIKEGIQIKVPSIKSPEFKKPNLSQKHIIVLAAVVVIICIYILSSYLMPVSHFPEGKPQQPEVPKTDTPLVNITQPSAVASPQNTAVILIPDIRDSKVYSIKFDVSHGFYPPVTTINKSDTIIWYSDENQRTRVVLVSKDGLFENRLMGYSDRYQYQFNQSGSYIFVLAEYPSLNEYTNATNEIIVK
jgi:hypothetical protein